MNVYSHLDSLPAFKNSVITIGTFDGVHLGHQKIISRLNALSEKWSGESIIITFHPHPRLVINPQDSSLRLLNTIDEKIALLEKYGIQNVVVVPFSRDFSEQPAEDYIRKFLVRNFNPIMVVIGYDHKFGKNRTGDYHLLESMKQELNYELGEITKETLDDIAISSTKIRQSLQNGDVTLANELLGYPYTITGTVVRGYQRGRELGYPTANILVNDEFKLIPSTGIYAVKVHVRDAVYNGMLSIGYNPTFSGKTQTVEVNILDFKGDIYGDNITIEMVEYLRGEIKFSSVPELIEAIKKDEEKTRQVFSS
ncbi:MAG: bifunctional riboflavin kinase/FAD synthetase [Bacteroidetes bacterium]|nr:bifunctional riboflavin kinase/FAD synthetase [Bacteroidota bacterium]